MAYSHIHNADMDIFEETVRFFERWKREKKIIGYSAFGREIFAVKIGEGSPVGIAQYSIHGREFITTKLAFLHAKRGVNHGSVWILPLTNPDGALLSQKGLSSVYDGGMKGYLLSLNGKRDFSLWKANGKGVDLNVNFDADWGTGKYNVFTPSSENFVGERPFSEPETQALKRFTLEVSPDYTVSYHTKGEEIYWLYNQTGGRRKRDEKLATVLSKATGYPLKETLGSVGGYKDWCISKLKTPAFTVEIGKDEYAHPIGFDKTLLLYERNKDALERISAVCERKEENEF
ncbi:MAG: hypothetical protein IIX01_03275 [Clostridia bacterium]|nr:hypothetical protein [Clostridia bacterium]